MSFCAICTSERGPFVRRPLGKRNAEVSVCTDCDTEPPIAYDADTHYQPSGGLLGLDETIAASRRVMGEAEYLRQGRLEDERSRAPAPALSKAELDLRAYDAESIRRISVNRRTWDPHNRGRSR